MQILHILNLLDTTSKFHTVNNVCDHQLTIHTQCVDTILNYRHTKFHMPYFEKQEVHIC
jgi:hypothetical protein